MGRLVPCRQRPQTTENQKDWKSTVVVIDPCHTADSRAGWATARTKAAEAGTKGRGGRPGRNRERNKAINVR